MSIEGRLELENGDYIHYIQRKSQNFTRHGIIYVHGYESHSNCRQARFLDKFCTDNGLSFVRFDFYGHGKSSGTLYDLTLSKMKQNFLDVLDKLTQGPQIIIGFSIGGLVSFVGALERPERIHSIISISNAADATYNNFHIHRTDEERQMVKDKGYFMSRVNHVVCYDLCIDSKNHLLVHDSVKEIALNCPIRFLHGMSDTTIHWKVSVALAKKVVSQDVKVQLVKTAKHGFNSKNELNILKETLNELVGMDSHKSKL
ncbi:palmitoyl-protein thioesterase ABHD10, mitochondrial-like isoform X1 [Clytia hemisphaerica]|uniref:Palmitoyl-protein thioesterase ABHD10, mitochondrial n=1 Tax=Clytia hemisphaerica TaxID=252671 RepID=A0A7M5VFU7_9CNID|eukprot:TCONS_00059614-protein